MLSMNELLQQNSFVIFKIPGCSNCIKMANIFDNLGLGNDYNVVNLDDLDNMEIILSSLKEITKASLFPMIFVNRKYIGSYKEVKQMIDFGSFGDILKKELGLSLIVDV